MSNVQGNVNCKKSIQKVIQKAHNVKNETKKVDAVFFSVHYNAKCG